MTMPDFFWPCDRPGTERQGIGEDAMIPVCPMVAVANIVEDAPGIKITLKKN